MKKRLNQILAAGLLAFLLALGYSALRMPQAALAQTGGLRRAPGFVFTRGCFVELNSGAAVAAGDTLYLDSAGKVQKLTAAQAANAIGGADNTVSAADQTVRVQFCGKATVTSDGAIAIGDKIGGTGVTTAGRVASLSSTLAVDAGATAVTSTAANGSIVSGDTPASRVLGRALQSAAGAGNQIEILLLVQ